LVFLIAILALPVAIAAQINPIPLANYPAFSCGTPENSSLQGGGQLPENYQPICTDPNQIKYIKVAYHFFRSEKLIIKNHQDECNSITPPFIYGGYGNFTALGDGFTGNYNGYKRAEDLINQANWEFENNFTHWRKANDPNVQNPPLNVTYPATPPQIPVRLLLAGVYFYSDNDAYNDLKGFATLQNEYGVDVDNVINIYDVPGYFTTGAVSEISAASKCMVVNTYSKYISPACSAWSLILGGTIICHEMGHLLGLNHTWDQNDDCDDTPLGFIFDKWVIPKNAPPFCVLNQRANCWAYDTLRPTCPNSTGGKPCDEWRKVSNNLMDYNQYAPHAVTVCQVGLMKNILQGNGNPYIHSCNGCMPSTAFFDINERLCMSKNPNGFTPTYILNGSASYNEDKWLLDICEVDPINTANCIGNIYNTGWQNGTIGQVDLLSFYTFGFDKTYRITLITDKTDCPSSEQFSRVITTGECKLDDIPNDDKFEMRATNPFNDNLSVFYSVKVAGTLQMRLVSLNDGSIRTLMNESAVAEGDYQLFDEVPMLSNGSYALQAILNGQLFSTVIVKQQN
jgi:hypothetical protein